MGRHTRERLVKKTPDNIYFGPPKDASYVHLTIAEFEAMRLKHFLNLNQKAAAENLNVSQPTFSRILDNAHRRITQALYEGRNIAIHGGNIKYKDDFKGFGCLKCEFEWPDKKASRDTNGQKCPKCSSNDIFLLVKEPL